MLTSEHRRHFIEPEGGIDAGKRQPASHLRKGFELSAPPQRGRLAITACGLYRAFVNGQEVTDQRLLPGCTFYHRRLQWHEFDVTSLLVPGPNAIGAILGDGWYRGKVGASSKRNLYGEKTSLLARLLVELGDGSTFELLTDGTWRATQDGPIRLSDLKDGEVYDARRELDGWATAGFDDAAWGPVHEAAYEGELVPAEGEPILEHETFTPTVLHTPDGSTVLDFGQNLFGCVRFRVTGNAGDVIVLEHGEVLDEHGNFTMRNLGLPGALRHLPITFVRQAVSYTLRAGTQTYQPSFSAQGFRYVRLSGWPGEPDPADLTAVALYSDMRPLGTFESSEPDIDQLVRNTIWSQKGNFVDIPTDCPTRERAGWTGDIGAFVETASYLMDTDRFLSKWLHDLAAQQRADGCVPNIVPDVGAPGLLDGSAGWGDAAVIVPYALYRLYGDRDVLEAQYDSMAAWLEFVARRAASSGLRSRLRRHRSSPYVADSGFHFGEWLEPGSSFLAIGPNLVRPEAEVATAYFAYSASLMSEIAAALGRGDDARRYAELATRVKAAYREAFTDGGIVRADRQARYVRPIALDLLPAADKARNAAVLNGLVIRDGYRVGTGFLSTPHVLAVLSDHGYVETAYRLAENRERPGWLYAVTKGATTIWESWEGVDDRGRPQLSHNHYAFGAVTGWFFSRVAGIQPLEPGFAAVAIRPTPGGSLTHARATYESRAGHIRSEWWRDGDALELEVEVPVRAEVTVPNGPTVTVEPGTHRFESTLVPSGA